MQQKNLLIGIAVLIIFAAAGGVMWFKGPALWSSGTSPASTAGGKPISEAWIEVAKPKVFDVSLNDSASSTPFKTGDTLRAGARIKTDAAGSATIHFPDGSLARLEPGTTITLDASYFDAQTEKLTVGFSLAVGRVWSKVVALVTPDSLWEVKTANTVATVRGTAFGVGFFNGQSRVVVTERAVITKVLDPKTGTEVGAETTVTQDHFAAVKNEDVVKIKEEKKVFVAALDAAPVEVRDWVSRNKEEDAKMDQRIEELKKEGLEGKDLRNELRRDESKKFEALEAKTEKGDMLQIKVDEGRKTDAKAEEQPREAAASDASIRGVPKFLTVTTDFNLRLVTEGDEIRFKAILTATDGTETEVTSEAGWQVVGPVGVITKPGIFTAKLDDSVSEFGEAPGSIAATWKDKDGKEFTGATVIFKVEAKVEPGGSTEG